MAIDDKPLYFKTFEEDSYKEETPRTSPEKIEREEYEERRQPREVTVERRTIHTMLREGQELKSLKRVSPEIIGSLFDRVEFLRTRINEIQSVLETRKRLHEELIKEIDTDINDKKALLAGLSDIDDIRDFKLDISTLRMEKRRENVQFWRDIFELTSELRDLMEQYQTESKIANLFKELKSGE